MRKILIVLSIVILLTTPVYGADALTRMLYADEVESFSEDQDAIILFQVLSIDDQVIEVDVIQVISGEVIDEKINISNQEIRIVGMLPDSNLYTGDFCVMSIKNHGDYYIQAWAALKADSGDYKTLRFYYSSHFEDIDVLQYYVNSGGVVKDYNFEDGRVYAVIDDERIDITLPRDSYLPEKEITDKNSLLEVGAIEVKPKAGVEAIETSSTDDTETQMSTKRPFIIILMGLTLIVAISSYSLGRWVRRRLSGRG